jgi:hypothetical protein
MGLPKIQPEEYPHRISTICQADNYCKANRIIILRLIGLIGRQIQGSILKWIEKRELIQNKGNRK